MTLLLTKLLFFSSIFIWLFPPIRHYRRKFFKFFLLVAITDPLALLFVFTFKSNPPLLYYIVLNFLIYTTLLTTKTIIKFRLSLIISLIILCLPTIFGLNELFNHSIILILYFIIFLLFLKFFIIEYVQNDTINFFYLALMFLELTTILKILNVIIGFTDAASYYITTTIFQILFGLFFSIFREDKHRIILRNK